LVEGAAAVDRFGGVRRGVEVAGEEVSFTGGFDLFAGASDTDGRVEAAGFLFRGGLFRVGAVLHFSGVIGGRLWIGALVSMAGKFYGPVGFMEGLREIFAVAMLFKAKDGHLGSQYASAGA